jgi:hypothetical protein
MRSFTALSITAALFLVLFSHCEKGPAGPKLTGTIYGFVILVNSNGAQPALRDSVVVSIDGTSLQTITDSAGKWSFPGMETGIYNFTFVRKGYETTKLVQVQFTGGADRDVATTDLCQAPSFYVDSIWQRIVADTIKDTAKIQLGAQLDTAIWAPTVPYRVFLFLGSDTSVSSNPSTYWTVVNSTMAFENGVDSTSIALTVSSLVNDGFVAGDTVYIAAYAGNAGSINSTYTDTVTGRTVYVNINPMRSNVIKVTIR